MPGATISSGSRCKGPRPVSEGSHRHRGSAADAVLLLLITPGAAQIWRIRHDSATSFEIPPRF